MIIQLLDDSYLSKDRAIRNTGYTGYLYSVDFYGDLIWPLEAIEYLKINT